MKKLQTTATIAVGAVALGTAATMAYKKSPAFAGMMKAAGAAILDFGLGVLTVAQNSLQNAKLAGAGAK